MVLLLVIAFIEAKKSPNPPWSISLGAKGVGQEGWIFIRTRFQTQPPGCTVYIYLRKPILLAAGWRRGLWFQSSFVCRSMVNNRLVSFDNVFKMVMNSSLNVILPPNFIRSPPKNPLPEPTPRRGMTASKRERGREGSQTKPKMSREVKQTDTR